MIDLTLKNDRLIDIKSVTKFENIMRQLPQIELEVKHHFCKDIYARELHIPKGIALTGKIHKYQQLNILAKGKIRVLIDGIAKEVEAPFVVVSPPGTKRIAYALEDCVWITVHGTDEKNVDLIEKQFVVENEKEYLEFIDDRQLRLL